MRIVLTSGGHRRATERLARVRAEFNAVVADMPAALESGDTSGWHDNFAFEDNQRQMQHLAARVRELERVLDQAEIVRVWETAPDRVVVGAGVAFRFDDDPEEHSQRVWIAGFGDGDPRAGRFSYDSPIGRALLGAEPGDQRALSVDGRKRLIDVLEVGPAPVGADDAGLLDTAPLTDRKSA